MALAAALVLAAGGTTLAADAPDVDVTGHWASPLEAGGIDLVQSGRNVRGSSSSGLHISGTIHGRHVQFTFWRGPSYAKADPEDRGSGTMDISPNGRRATSTWQSQAEEAENRGTFAIARAEPPDSGEAGPPVEDGQASTEPDPGGYPTQGEEPWPPSAEFTPEQAAALMEGEEPWPPAAEFTPEQAAALMEGEEPWPPAAEFTPEQEPWPPAAEFTPEQAAALHSFQGQVLGGIGDLLMPDPGDPGP